MNERPNFYRLLDIDPTVEDEAIIAKTIQDKRRRWSTDAAQGSPNARRKARTYLDQIGEIERVMGDQEERRKEAAAARKLLKEARKASFERLDQMIDILRAGGTCTSDDVKKIMAALGGAISEKDVIGRLRERGLTVERAGESGPGSKPSDKPCLDSTRMAQLRPSLALLGVKNLYDFLEKNRRASARSLKEHADQLNRRLISDGHSDPFSNARKELCGSCMAIFASDADKQKYDNALAFEAMEEMRGNIDLAGSKNNYLTIEQQDVLVEQARKRGVDAADARAFLGTIAATRKWGMQSATKLPSENRRQCGHCLALAKDPKAAHCSECGFSLTIECPRCSKVVPTQYAACTSCGFHIGDWEWIKLEVDKADRLIRERQVDEASKQLKVLLRSWPGWKMVQARLDDAERLIKERQSDRGKLDGLIWGARLFEAQTEAERFERKWGTRDIATQSSRIAEGIARAGRAFDEGQRRRAEGKIEEAILQYRSALTVCVDYDLARKAMALVPPMPPKSLAIVAQGRGFQLRWNAGDKTAERYVVVRKARAAPAHAQDGIRRETFDTTDIDPDVQEGVPWHYAVFSCRDGVSSTSAARSGPHLRVAPVQQLSALAGDGQVKLTWILPNGAVGVEVWRRQGSAPDRSGLGVRLSASRESMQDSGLANDVTLGYLVVPLFEDPHRPGGFVQGAGTQCVAIPTAPPAAIIDLRLVREHGVVQLSWTAPSADVQVHIRQLQMAPDYQVGAILTKAQADALGTPVVATTRGSTQVRAFGVAELWFVPLTVKAMIAVVGKPASIALLDGFRNLTADHDSRDIHLTWEWPLGTSHAAVCYRYDRYPISPNDADVIRQDVTMAQYQRERMFTLRRVERRPHYFALFAVTPDRRLHSDPVTRLVQMRKPRQVRYRIVSPQSFWARLTGEARQLELEMSGSGHLPETVLVAKPRVVPTGPEDGEKIMCLPEMELAGTYRVRIPDVSTRSGNLAKLFFTNARHSDEIRLVSGSLNKLKL
jgi:hypothetical protein